MAKDPFIEGLRRVFDADPDLKPATVSARAGLDKSTIRKMLDRPEHSPRHATAERIANALGMAVADITALGGGFASAPTETHSQGFGEPEVATLTAIGQHSARLNEVARALAPDLRTHAFYVVGRHLPELLLKTGDVLVCDLNPPPDPAPGTIVLVNVADPDTGSAQTLVRRLYPPFLAGDPSNGDTPARFDPETMAIMGVVVASFRLNTRQQAPAEA
ncbi:hypothetical protein SAMN05444722_1711 [Rhodovulum sp. ES.010]|uniref:helix-turn-helix domain-containing protein n=1 Tax=Rhodovulum sp. ES.010 TaxID=1882821 RepID=UPI00092B0B92|nr:helix-turn-helix transcriptional regulator [Rhodovulum sp. ES.010]SIO36889.1 hypothetical protein SAMN05444722_1711 [Rhodovulum sp. ES.010]